MWQFEQDKDANALLEPGMYPVIVDRIEMGESKAGNKTMKLFFKVISGPNKGRIVIQNYNLEGNPKAVEISRSQLKALLKSSGSSLNLEGPEGFRDCTALASIKIKKDEGYGEKNIISYFKPLAKDDPANSSSLF